MKVVVGEVWARNANNALDPNEALALAYAELGDFRAERDAPAAKVRRVVVAAARAARQRC